jgi:hypothetical protein
MKSYLETRKKQREEERRFRHAGYHHAPTPKQIQRLQSMGIPIESGLTEDRAAALIDPPTEEQIQRLTFHRIAISPYLTEKDAQKLIDSYRRENPESEAAYRAWTATA